MAGNEIETLSAEILTKMKYVKKVDFRMNKLTLTTSKCVFFFIHKFVFYILKSVH